MSRSRGKRLSGGRFFLACLILRSRWRAVAQHTFVRPFGEQDAASITEPQHRIVGSDHWRFPLRLPAIRVVVVHVVVGRIVQFIPCGRLAAVRALSPCVHASALVAGLLLVLAGCCVVPPLAALEAAVQRVNLRVELPVP